LSFSRKSREFFVRTDSSKPFALHRDLARFFITSGSRWSEHRTCRLIFERMVKNRRELRRVLARELSFRPLNQPEPRRTPEEERQLHQLDRRHSGLIRVLRFDFECLYTFGAIFLDQWAISAAYLSGLEKPGTMRFVDLARLIEGRAKLPPALKPVAESYLPDFRWLKLQLRTFRNRFVEHADRPWQRATTADLHGMSFSLSTPSPPGWIDDDEFNADIKSLLRLAPEWLQEADDDYWEKARPRALLGTTGG
jgi:hypothetical protein